MANKLKVVIDTNIFLYGYIGATDSSVKIMDLVANNDVHVVFAQNTFGELTYILKNMLKHSKIISSTENRLQILYDLVELFYNSRTVNTRAISCDSIKDKSDEMFVKCAIAGNVDYLISDDYKSGMHKLDKYRFKVVSADEFIDNYYFKLEA